MLEKVDELCISHDFISQI